MREWTFGGSSSDGGIRKEIADPLAQACGAHWVACSDRGDSGAGLARRSRPRSNRASTESARPARSRLSNRCSRMHAAQGHVWLDLANAYPADARPARFLLRSAARHHLHCARSGSGLACNRGRYRQTEVYLFRVLHFRATDSAGRDLDQLCSQTPRLRPMETAPSPRLSGAGTRGPSFHLESQTQRSRAGRLWASACGATQRATRGLSSRPQSYLDARDMT